MSATGCLQANTGTNAHAQCRLSGIGNSKGFSLPTCPARVLQEVLFGVSTGQMDALLRLPTARGLTSTPGWRAVPRRNEEPGLGFARLRCVRCGTDSLVVAKGCAREGGGEQGGTEEEVKSPPPHRYLWAESTRRMFGLGVLRCEVRKRERMLISGSPSHGPLRSAGLVRFLSHLGFNSAPPPIQPPEHRPRPSSGSNVGKQ